MARKRMFSLDVIDTDLFLDMPTSARLLYYDLGMRADDDGFISNYKKIVRMTGASEDDIKILIAKNFLIPFNTGIIVIRHWKINNYIQKDRYTETIYKDEKLQLTSDESSVYNLDTECIHSIDKIRLDKSSIDNNIPACEDKSSTALSVKSEELQKPTKHKYGLYKNVLLKDEELQKLQTEYKNWEELINYLDEYIEMKGYKAKSHYLCIKKWVINAVKEQGFKSDKKQEQRASFINYDQRKYEDLNGLYANNVKEEKKDYEK